MQLYSSISTAGAPPSRHSQPYAEAEAGSRCRRRLLWAGIAAATLFLLVFVPPLIKVNRYQRQIALTMSASLGRPVHLDNVSLHLLPVPGLTLSNLVVSEDPAFGSEPTIRADTVEATLRPGSLWRRPVEFSTVRFIEPHVNLVRNPAGRWNLADVLLHASHVPAAPTAQTHAGPAPRFPYIEATGGRVNLKLGEEKLPFSITDADFALWLPSPNQWRVRLEGQPARTDTNLSDPGILRIEGGLQRAETATGIPVDLHATWHNAPLGEATRLLLGEDQGWRGTLNVDSTLTGTLSEARLGAKLTVGGLRRAEFVATQPLDLQMTCGAGLQAAAATAGQLRCSVPDDAPTPLRLEAETVNLNRLDETRLAVTAEAVPLHWGLLWAALFSPRVPIDRHPDGRIEVHLSRLTGKESLPEPAAPRAWLRRGARVQFTGRSRVLLPIPAGGPWSGEIRVQLPAATEPRSAEAMVSVPTATAVYPTQLVWHPAVAPAPAGKPTLAMPPAPGWAFTLQPVSLSLGGGEVLNVTAAITRTGYTVAANGNASTAELLRPARYLPQLADGLETVLSAGATPADAVQVDFTCNHPWGDPPTCINLRASGAGGGKPPQRLGVAAYPVSSSGTRPSGTPPSEVRPSGTLPSAQTPALLAPRSLSPYDNHPVLGGAAPSGASPYSAPAPSTNSPHL